MKSASDNDEYPLFCALAAAHDEVFNTFRQNPVYQSILEHFSFEDGLAYLKAIELENPNLLESIDLFKTNDQFGGAQIYNYEKYGAICPSTIHYIKQLSSLEKHFGDLTDKDIVEIGGGYGGLAKLVMDRFKIKSYTIYDLPEVNELTKKYLSKFGDKYIKKIDFGDLNKESERKYNICISNCAFTECTPVIQDLYLQKVIKYSIKGIMIYNFRVESYHPVILLNKFEQLGLKGLGAEYPSQSMPIFFILVWNSNIKLNLLPYKRRYLHKISPYLYHSLLKSIQKIKARSGKLLRSS